jgi:hypothetical protein
MFDPNSITNARLRQIYDYWDAKRAGRPMPARADVDPVEIAWALGDVSLIDVLPDGEFRWRVDGSNLVAFFGCDMSGKKLSTYPFRRYLPQVRENFARPVDRREPVFLTRRFEDGERRWNYDTIFLPLSGDGRQVDMLLQMIDIGRPNATQ